MHAESKVSYAEIKLVHEPPTIGERKKKVFLYRSKASVDQPGLGLKISALPARTIGKAVSGSAFRVKMGRFHEQGA